MSTNTSEQLTEAQQKTPPEQARQGKKFNIRQYFTATRIAYLALFTALSFVLRLPSFEFMIFPAVPFLKMDFSNTFVMIAGFALGPVSGIIVGALKEVLYGLFFSQTVGVGELANMLFILAYALVPSIVYVKHKGIKTVIVTLIIGCVSQVVFSVPINYFINFPFFWTMTGGSTRLSRPWSASGTMRSSTPGWTGRPAGGRGPGAWSAASPSVSPGQC